MEYFTSVLASFCLVTWILWKYSLLDGKGWGAVFVAFGSLIYVQRVHVRQAKEREQEDIRTKLQAFQKLQNEKYEMAEWWKTEKERVYKGVAGGSDPTGDTFLQYTQLFDVVASADQVVLDKITSQNESIKILRRDNGLKLEGLDEKLDIDMAYHSNAIEGNRISRSETATILSGTIAGEGKTLRELEDMVGHSQALQHVRNLVREERKSSTIMSVDDILAIHKLVLRNHETAGKFRSENYVSAGNRKLFLAMPDEIESLMAMLVSWIGERRALKDHPLLVATNVQYMFGRIHPFLEGNEQTARLLSNLVLMKCGFPPITVPVEQAENYQSGLAAWDGGDPTLFTNFMAGCLQEMFSRYEKGVAGMMTTIIARTLCLTPKMLEGWMPEYIIIMPSHGPDANLLNLIRKQHPSTRDSQRRLQ